MAKRKAGLPLTPYDQKIIGPTGYRWVEASPGVFVTMSLHATAEEHAANLEKYAREIEAARREEASSGEVYGS
ncbi:MAG: hypothetical protein IT436_09820 [Phycisphaerales bacterium]|nr:hypothetical protein [Phycisphaerales bacterium]